ncbi:MAG: arylesterase [Gammaproteobacteria bacterium]|nr:arylesterase [Gammaproteobacteria bacterium]
MRLYPIKITLYVMLACLALACTDNTSRLPRLSPDAVILAFGDSLTYGTGADRAQSYPLRLAQLIGREVINAGVPGEVTSSGRQRLPGLLDKYQPGLLILCHGGNDLLRKLDPNATRNNLQAMLVAARSRGIPVVLLGVPRPGLFLMKSAELYEQLAKEYAMPYEGDIIPAVESDNSLKSDPIHPNEDGYKQIAEAVYRLLRDSGAL